MAICVNQLRLSFIWVEGFPGLIPSDAPMAFLGDPKLYREDFERIKAGVNPLNLPWPSPAGHHFWEYYLGNSSLHGIDGEMAWKYLVPLRSPSLCKLDYSPPISAMSVEGYHYPLGVGVLINVVLKKDCTLHEMVEAAFDAKDARTYHAQWHDGATPARSIKAVARRALEVLRKAALGSGLTGSSPQQPPFTIATVVEGDVENPALENPPGGEVHRALEALCCWHPLWKMNPLHPMNETTCYPFKRKGYVPAGHVLYGLEYGRAVWFPGYFAKTLGKKTRTLGCYHRNLALATLQTAALLDSVRLGSTLMKGVESVPLVLEDLVRKATAHLTSLYLAAKGKTYRSWSPHRQIKDGGSVDMINSVRDRFGWPMLDK